MTTGEVGHDEFLTLISRSDLFVRTPLTDGVCSSVLEAMYLGIPVVAADNGSRPAGVVTYDGSAVDDMVDRITKALMDINSLRSSISEIKGADEDSIAQLVDILERECLL
jgi:glycosyltransferase involved in cell wall biosynthesis